MEPERARPAAPPPCERRFATRLFDGPEYVFVNESALPSVLDQAADRELAYEAAAAGIVLLQVRMRSGRMMAAPPSRAATPPPLPPPPQNNGVLPLSLGGAGPLRNVAVLGPNGGCAPGERYPCPAEVATVGHYVALGAPIQTVVDAVANASAVLGFNYSYQVRPPPSRSAGVLRGPPELPPPARPGRRSARASRRTTRRSSLRPSPSPRPRTSRSSSSATMREPSARARALRCPT